MREVENFSSRFDTAKRRAEDEVHWPLKMADRSFAQPKTVVVQNRLHHYLEQRRPLFEAYSVRIEKDRELVQKLRKEREEIPPRLESFRLQHKNVSLTPSLEGLAKLRKTCLEVSRRAEAASRQEGNGASPAPGARTGVNPDIVPLEKLIE